ncbi:MAG: dodecin family protein [Polyangiales bacterium]
MDHNGTQGQGNGYRSNGEGYRASGPQGGSYSRGAEGYGGRDDYRGAEGYGGRNDYRGSEYGGQSQGGYGYQSRGGYAQGGSRGSEGYGGRNDYRGNEDNTTYAQGGYSQGGYSQGGYGSSSQGSTRGGQGRDSFQERPEDSDAVVKVIEVLAQSEQGWDDAARRAVEQASHSVRNIRSLYIKDMQAVVRDGRIAQYRITAKLSFVLDGSDQPHDDRGRSSRMR